MSRTPSRWLLGWLVAALATGVSIAQDFPETQFQPLTPAPQMQMPETVPAGAARVVQMIGDVTIMKGSEPWVLSVGELVEPQQVIQTGPSSYAVMVLEDGSHFEIFADSRVTFRANRGDWSDLLDLWLGRVKVYIQKLGDQPNHNRVFTPTAVISVRGTVFDVMIEDEYDTTLVSVDEGVVDVRHRLIGESKSKPVEAGQSLRVYKNVPLAQSMVDKNDLARRVLDGLGDALYTVLVRQRTSVPSGGGTSTGGGGGPQLPGDTGGGTPPTPDDGGSGGTTTPTPPPSGPPIPPPPPPGS